MNVCHNDKLYAVEGNGRLYYDWYTDMTGALSLTHSHTHTPSH